jgi:hypothetical protein
MIVVQKLLSQILAYSFQSSQLITSVLSILSMEPPQWLFIDVGPYLVPGVLMGAYSAVSKSIRKTAFQIWISQAIDEALRSMKQTEVAYTNLKCCFSNALRHRRISAHQHAWYQVRSNIDEQPLGRLH